MRLIGKAVHDSIQKALVQLGEETIKAALALPPPVHEKVTWRMHPEAARWALKLFCHDGHRVALRRRRALFLERRSSRHRSTASKHETPGLR